MLDVKRKSWPTVKFPTFFQPTKIFNAHAVLKRKKWMLITITKKIKNNNNLK